MNNFQFVCHFSIIITQMKSVRLRKLMLGIKVSQQQPSAHYEVTVSPGVNCECFIQFWNEQKLQTFQQYQSSKALLEHFSDSFELPEEMLGKKSSQIIISKNQLYCLKLINQEDIQTFSKIFEAFCQMKNQNKESLLIPILGVVIVHTIHQNKNKWIDAFLIMPNLKTSSTILFDIKGHCDSRFVPVTDFRDFGFGKDQNFIKSSHKKQLQNLSQASKVQIYQRILKDLQFLKKCKVIDYSLILVFKSSKAQPGEDKIKWYEIDENNFVSFVIIDYLQEFNQRKRLQNKFKSLFHKQISSVDPQTYANRLLEFMQKNVFSQYQAK